MVLILAIILLYVYKYSISIHPRKTLGIVGFQPYSSRAIRDCVADSWEGYILYFHTGSPPMRCVCYYFYIITSTLICISAFQFSSAIRLYIFLYIVGKVFARRAIRSQITSYHNKSLLNICRHRLHEYI